MSLILRILLFRVPDVVRQSVSCPAIGGAELTGLLLRLAVPLTAVTLHLEDLVRKLILTHLIECIFRVLALDLADNFLLGDWLDALSRLLGRVIGRTLWPSLARLGGAQPVLLLSLLDHCARLTLLD